MIEEAPPAVEATAPGATTAPSGAPSTDATDKKRSRKDKAKRAGGRSNLVPALVLAVGIAAGGYFMGNGSTTRVVETVEVPVARPEPGEIAKLDALTVNLAGGRYLRVGVSILTAKDFEVIEGDATTGEPSRFTPEFENRLRDQVIANFAGRTLSEVVGAEQLDEAKVELLERANTVLDGQALEVYFTEFVTQ